MNIARVTISLLFLSNRGSVGEYVTWWKVIIRDYVGQRLRRWMRNTEISLHLPEWEQEKILSSSSCSILQLKLNISSREHHLYHGTTWNEIAANKSDEWGHKRLPNQRRRDQTLWILLLEPEKQLWLLMLIVGVSVLVGLLVGICALERVTFGWKWKFKLFQANMDVCHTQEQ